MPVKKAMNALVVSHLSSTLRRLAPSCALSGVSRSYSTRPISRELADDRPKVTIQTIRKLYKEGKPITMMTAYDFPTSTACSRAGVDMVLVGDSLAMVALGYEDTSEITLDEMIHHSKAVARGIQSPFIVSDLPFGTYHSDDAGAVNSAIRMVKEGRAEAVKVECTKRTASKVDAIVNGAGIPVVGHIGLTPQTAVSLGGFRVQGKSVSKAQRLIDDALALEAAGCFSIVLEAMPSLVAEAITKILHIPTIGIGAGAGTSGQVLVLSDMVGLFDRFTPKFCQRFSDLGPSMIRAIEQYNSSVRDHSFPAEGTHTYAMPASAEESWRNFVLKQFGIELSGTNGSTTMVSSAESSKTAQSQS